jgi:signal transduction histidine kinase
MEGEEVSVRGNAALLRILLRNLIDNAARHTPAGTSVHIDITDRQGQTSLSVSDNGPGIPAPELDKLGERFYRPLGTSASGSGLGLSIVKRIAEIHSASMRLSTPEIGNGLSVTIIFKS